MTPYHRISIKIEASIHAVPPCYLDRRAPSGKNEQERESFSTYTSEEVSTSVLPRRFCGLEVKILYP